MHVLRPDSWRLTLALFLTWFLMGLWHGAAWSFALWGIWHAAFVWLYRLAEPRLGAIPKPIRSIGGWGVTLAIGMLAWIPFRARSLDDAFTLLGRVFDIHAYGYLTFQENFYLVVAVVFTAMLMLYFIARWLAQPRAAILRSVAEIGTIAATAFVVFIFLRPVEQFIYFQF